MSRNGSIALGARRGSGVGWACGTGSLTATVVLRWREARVRSVSLPSPLCGPMLSVKEPLLFDLGVVRKVLGVCVGMVKKGEIIWRQC